MNKLVAIIIGGTGQFGVTISKLLLKKKYNVIITTRNLKKSLYLKKKNLNICKLNIYNKKEVKNIINKYNPNIIFYLAGQSSPVKSFKKKLETYRSNYLGCKIVLQTIKNEKINCKFLNAASSEMFGKIGGVIKINSLKKPNSPYGLAKLEAYKITQMFRSAYGLKTYNAIIFNTESFYRKNHFLIPKICKAAIKAKKYGTKTEFGDINISREWNWCEEQSKYLLKFLDREPQDFILSNGKKYTVAQMLKYAFSYFSLNYLNYISINKKYFRKNEVRNKNSDYLNSLKKNKIKRKVLIHGKKILELMIKNYIKNNN